MRNGGGDADGDSRSSTSGLGARRGMMVAPATAVRSLLYASLLLDACSGGQNSGAQDSSDAGSVEAPEFEAGPNDVVGTVVSSDRAPFPGVRVRIGGSSTTTDGRGRFIIRDVPAKYDVALSWPGKTDDGVVYGTWGHFVVGLTTRRIALVGSAQAQPANFVGVGIDYPPPTVVDQHYALYATDGIDTQPFGIGGGDALKEIWFGLGPVSPATRDIVLLAYTTTSGRIDSEPTHFVGVARNTFTLKGTNSFGPAPVETRWAPTLTPVAEVVATVTATPAPGQTIYAASPIVRIEPSLQWNVATGPRRQSPWTLVLPKIPGMHFGTLLVAYDSGKPGSAASSAVVPLMADDSMPPITMMAPPVLASSTGSLHPGTTISWTGGGGICAVDLQIFSGPNQQRPLRIVVRDSSTATVPDLSSIGYAFPPLTTFTLIVTCSQRLDGTTAIEPAASPRRSLRIDPNA